MSDLKVRIGPSVDRAAFDAAFQSISASAKRAFGRIADDAQKSSRTEEEGARRAGRTKITELQKQERAEAAALRKSETAARKSARDAESAERKKTQAAVRAIKEREMADVIAFRNLNQMQRDAERSSARMYREMKRQAKDAADANNWKHRKSGSNPRVAVGLGHGVSLGMSGPAGLAAGAMRMGMGIAGDMAHAYGVDTDLGSLMHKNADLDTLAVQITNEAHEKGQRFANAGDLKKQAFDIGTNTGTGANDIMEGFQEFVGKTGDLSTASDSMEQLAKIAKGTGSSLKDVVGAAADVSNQLGDIPNKGKAVNDIMKVMAGEAKLGAVPMRALASQMSKVVASAQMFEGDVGKNMATLGAIAQETRLKGGAASPAQAATAVNSLAGVFRTKARVEAFREAGININGSGGKLRNVEDIIVESLQKTQKGTLSASNVALNALYGGKLPGKAVGGFESIFRSTFAESHGNEQERLAEATKAVREEFDRLTRAAMDQKEVDDSFARAMETGQSKATVFNNKMQELSGKIQDALLPAMNKLIPAAGKAADALGKVLGWAMGPETPDIGQGKADEHALHKAIGAGKVSEGLLQKSKQDAYELDRKGLNKQTEAANLRKEAHGSWFGFAAKGAANQVWQDATADTPWYTKARKLAGITLPGDKVNEENTIGAQRRDLSNQAGTAAREGSDATASAEAIRGLNKYIEQNALMVHIVKDDTASTGGDAAKPSTDSLSDKPSDQ